MPQAWDSTTGTRASSAEHPTIPDYHGASLTSDCSRPVSRPSRRSACDEVASLDGSDARHQGAANTQRRRRCQSNCMSDSKVWEYATVPLLTHATKQILDQWGADGWELVTVLPGPTGEQHVAYLKRPK